MFQWNEEEWKLCENWKEMEVNGIRDGLIGKKNRLKRGGFRKCKI